MSFITDPTPFAAFVQVVMIDLVLAGDNVVVIGLAAASVHPSLRRKAIFFGILAATVLRIMFAVLATQLLSVVGLLLAGGILLAWVCWKMWLDLRHPEPHHHAGEACEFSGLAQGCEVARVRDFRRAVLHILIADISMSLDNVLAVSGAAREHPVVLAFGLLLSIGLMGVAASYIAALLQRHRWIAYLGLAIIAFVAFRMIFHGSQEVLVAAGILVQGHG